MYMVLYWVTDEYVTCIQNSDGSIMLFDTIEEADEYANNSKCSEKMRVITIEGVV